jgi:hypothetical protein
LDDGTTLVGTDGFDENSLIAGPAPDDSLVRIGHLYDVTRQNSVYITSSEMDSPYIQTNTGVDRPDNNVTYFEPAYKTNDRGLFEFNAEDVSEIEVYSAKGLERFTVTDGKFYAPNKYYINENNERIFANYENYIVPNYSVRVRLGNLNNIYDQQFKTKQPHGYGLYADNVFLKGEFILNNGKTVFEATEEYVKSEVGGVKEELDETLSIELGKVKDSFKSSVE